MANLAAIPLTLIFEMPFGNIGRYLFRNVKILPIPGPKNTSEKKFKRDRRFDVNFPHGNFNLAFENEKEH